jgi:hypothetical protein
MKLETALMDPTRTKIITCATVIEEMIPLLPSQVRTQTLDFGLHRRPDGLRRTLQDAIDASAQAADTIILGYGLCSLAVVGLHSDSCTLVVPRVDDCIAIFLGSRAAYRQQAGQEPGTYYLTKGWIQAGDGPFEAYQQLVERYGQQRADRMIRLTLKNYTRLAFINTGQYDLERFRQYARQTSVKFGLRYEEIQGSTTLVKKMIYGPWDDEFVVVPPGREIRYQDFASTTSTMRPTFPNKNCDFAPEMNPV